VASDNFNEMSSKIRARAAVPGQRRGLIRYSSFAALAALVASAATPVALWIIGDHADAVLFALLSVLLWVMHRGNIARLLRGTEQKIGASTGS
jgi:acyl phosphate:glycerol-3-phosphate acyltransferase